VWQKKTYDNITIHNNYFFSTINPKDFLVSLKYTGCETKIIFKPVKLLKSNQINYIYIYIFFLKKKSSKRTLTNLWIFFLTFKKKKLMQSVTRRWLDPLLFQARCRWGQQMDKFASNKTPSFLSVLLLYK
jgi:hypothetical protein